MEKYTLSWVEVRALLSLGIKIFLQIDAKLLPHALQVF
jgi:hypothetical protein